MKTWFEVDKTGLSKLLERRGKAFILHELVSNAWDEQSTRVDVKLERIAGTRNVRLTVHDNNPAGFADLSHAWVLFAESKKKGEAAVGKRGRFNLGEKLVLAMCESAEIATTSGSVIFDASGRRTSRKRLDTGSCVTAVLRMTEAERLESDLAALALLPPAGVVTTYNGTVVAARRAVATCEAVLQTEIGDEEGRLRRTQRRTQLQVIEAADGETPMLHELGIPVVESGLRWHVNVGQKVPLSFNRDNVPPAYHACVRAQVLELMHEHMGAEDANAAWVRDAIEHHGADLSDQAIASVIDARFGKCVSYDMNDAEANARAVAAGYTVVHGSQMSAGEWDAVRRAGAIQPAGKVTPSPKPYSEDGRQLKVISAAEWTPGMHAVAGLAQRIAKRVMDRDIGVQIAMEPTWPFAATYGSGRLVLNCGRVGRRWFDGPMAEILDLLIHEFGHHNGGGNHLSSQYHDAITKVGAQIAALALAEPGLFERNVEQRACDAAMSA